MEFRTEFQDYKDEMAFLREYLTEQGYLYYVLDAPVIPDYEYDRLNRRLEELEAEHPEEITPDSPTQRVGGKILDAFQPYTHEVPLESLQDVFNEGEVAAFCEKMEEALGPMAEYSVEPKVDGLSVALEYRDGVFVRGATRGDGRVGEDVTENPKRAVAFVAAAAVHGREDNQRGRAVQGIDVLLKAHRAFVRYAVNFLALGQQGVAGGLGVLPAGRIRGDGDDSADGVGRHRRWLELADRTAGSESVTHEGCPPYQHIDGFCGFRAVIHRVL